MSLRSGGVDDRLPYVKTSSAVGVVSWGGMVGIVRLFRMFEVRREQLCCESCWNKYEYIPVPYVPPHSKRSGERDVNLKSE